MSTFKYYKNGQWNVVSGEITGDTLPIGSMIPYGSTTAPTNWLICDGSAISRTEYSELFEVIGTSYGAGDGSTTFNLPNYKGRVPVGYDSSQTEFNTLGKTGGSKYMQQHNHPLTSSGEYVMYWAGSSGNVSVNTTGNNVSGFNNKYTQNAGTGDSGNLQPYQVSCFIIKAKQSSGYVGNIANTYSTSQTDTYSCDFINNNLMPYVLFNGSSKDTITLSDSASNYEYFEIYYANEFGIYSSIKVCNPQGKKVLLISSWVYDTETGGTQIQTKHININNNQITNGDFSNFNVQSSGTWSGTYDSIYIKRVVGYK